MLAWPDNMCATKNALWRFLRTGDCAHREGVVALIVNCPVKFGPDSPAAGWQMFGEEGRVIPSGRNKYATCPWQLLRTPGGYYPAGRFLIGPGTQISKKSVIFYNVPRQMSGIPRNSRPVPNIPSQGSEGVSAAQNKGKNPLCAPKGREARAFSILDIP